MNKLVSLVCRALCFALTSLCTVSYAAAGSGVERAALLHAQLPRHLAGAVARWTTTQRLPPLFTLRLSGGPVIAAEEATLGATSVGSPVFDEVFSVLRKPNDRPRIGPGLEAHSPSLPAGEGKADLEYARHDYSFLRALPTACLAAGVVTLSLTIGSGERFALQVKPGSLAGLVGFRGRF